MNKNCQSILLATALLLFLHLSLFGQDYSTTNRKAIKLFSQGDLELYQKRNAELAKLNYLEALENDPNFIEPYVRLAEIADKNDEKEAVVSNLSRVIAINPSYQPNLIFALAEAELNLGRYEEASRHYNLFLPFAPDGSELKDQAKMDLLHCKFGLEHINQPVPFNPENMGKAINSPLDEYFPCITADDQILLYTRQLESPNSPFGYNEDFYESVNNQGWKLSKNIGMPINTQNNEGAPSLSADGRVLVFTACELYGNYGAGRNGYGSCDLFVTQKFNEKWSRPVNLGKPVNSNQWETQPSVTSDGRTIYFIRGISKSNGRKEQDIYVTHYTEEKVWTRPVRLNNNVNTPFREESVFIHPDGQTLYFASNGHPGMGGLDLFMSKKDENGEWGPAVNLGYPINTSNNENSLLVDASGTYGYFASNREEGEGGMDLYRFKLPESIKPEAVTYLKGKVYDSESKKPLYTKFELIDLETKEVTVRAYSNEGSGDFLIAIPAGKNYALNASKSGYLFYSDNFSLKGITDQTQPFRKDVPLQPIKIGAKTILNNIFFDTDKFDLKPESEIELEKLITFLNDNPTVKIELSGHTDEVGDNAYNQKLSENRAKAVYNFLINKGIESLRLTYKGYGESLPVADNNTAEGRAKNRRTEFKIIDN